MIQDKTLENLLDLDGVKYVIDENLGLWVKFEVKQVKPTKERPYGIRYAFTLHDRFNTRMMGFDNAHAIEFAKKENKAYDHWHRDDRDEGKPYEYINAGKLIEDFWKEVSKVHHRLEESKK